MKISDEYVDYTDMFLPKAVAKLLKYIRIKKYFIHLEEGKQPPYGPIYSLELVELKTLKVYIKTNLKNAFI